MTGTDTLARVPRRADSLPDAVAARLGKAAARRAAAHETADDQFRAEVLAALSHGSIREVARAAGVSPTTVQAWKDGKDRAAKRFR